MSLSLFSTWFVGTLNGYKLKEDGLPNSIKYGTMALATGIHIAKGFGNLKIPIINAGASILGIGVIIPIMVGTTFCVGNYVGKGVRYAEDSQSGSLKFKLLGKSDNV
jgi:hypothetical protein